MASCSPEASRCARAASLFVPVVSRYPVQALRFLVFDSASLDYSPVGLRCLLVRSAPQPTPRIVKVLKAR